eukprot:gene17940-biopygen33946
MTNINDCEPHPCKNGGRCTDGIAKYTCTCRPGFWGVDCENDLDECAEELNDASPPAAVAISSPCDSDGTAECVNEVDKYTCRCKRGYSGKHCQVNDDDCLPAPRCQNGGTCTDGVAEFTCACATGWEGSTCEENINECGDENPCLNGGTCTDGIGEYTCSCLNGWVGEHCEVDNDDCESVSGKPGFPALCCKTDTVECLACRQNPPVTVEQAGSSVPQVAWHKKNVATPPLTGRSRK